MIRNYKVEVHPSLKPDESFCEVIKFILSDAYLELNFVRDVFGNLAIILGDYQINIGSKNDNGIYEQIQIDDSTMCKSIAKIRLSDDFNFINMYVAAYMDYPIALIQYR